MEAVRYGIIGLGIQGMTYASMLSGISPYPGMPPADKPRNCRLAAISSRDAAKEAICTQQFPGIPFYRSWKEMVHSGTIDAVIITVPHYQHPEIAIYCMEHGIHVLVEKPAGVYTKAVRQMNRCARNHPEIAFGIMFNQRANPVYYQVKQILASSELGHIRRSSIISTDWWRPDSYYAQSSWRGTWGGEGGGILLNQAVHQLDLWLWLCGIPSKVHSICRYGFGRSIAVENDVTATLTYPDGAVGSLIASSHDPIGTTRFEIDLDKGKILIENGTKATIFRLQSSEAELNANLSMMDLYLLSSQSQLFTCQIIEQTQPVNQHLSMLENFAQHLQDGTPLIAPGTDGMHSVELVNAILLSDWLGKTVATPIDEDLYLELLNQRIAEEGKFPIIEFSQSSVLS